LLALGIETSTPTASIALMDDESLIAEVLFSGQMNLAEQLAPRIKELLVHEGVRLAGLDGIAVSLGPGSFTGLRIGVATAKALAHAVGLPLVGVPTADAVAEAIGWDGAALIHVVLPAWRSRYWLASYLRGADGLPTSIGEPRLVDLSSLIKALEASDSKTLVAGTVPASARDKVGFDFGDQVAFAPAFLSIPRASMVAASARNRLACTERTSPHSLKPLYYRLSQAELSKGVDLGL